MNNLKKALYVLLYDQYDIPDMNIEFDDETYIGYIIDVLIQQNDNIWPFKNYNCEEICSKSIKECRNGYIICCNRKKEDIWKEFIKIN